MAKKKKNKSNEDLYLGYPARHFVDLCIESVRNTENAQQTMRRGWSELWRAYENEREEAETAKEPWQSDISLNKPFSTVQQAKSVIRKAMLSGAYRFYDYLKKPQYSTEDSVDQIVKIAKAMMDEFQGEHQGDFPTAFVDAAEMAFAVGQSMEMIPIMGKDGKFSWELTPPWQIYRDPYAVPRDPQSGNYWIRETYVEKWELLEMEKKGIIFNVELAMASADDESRKAREEQDAEKRVRDSAEENRFFTSYKILDFYGYIVSPSGELLLEKGHFTILGQTLIRAPKKVNLGEYRWPGVSFSALPHMLRYEGKSIIEGVMDLWNLLNNLLNLHVDNLNWAINNVWERDGSRLVNPMDDEIFPGKTIEVKSGQGGEQVYKPLLTKRTTNEALANMNFLDMAWQEGSFVTDVVSGLPGSRSEITKGEVQIKQQQSMGVFHSMAKDLEVGAKNALWLANEVIGAGIKKNNEVWNMPKMTPEIVVIMWKERKNLKKYVNIQVSGISNLINKADMIQRIEGAMAKALHPLYARYVRQYNLLKAYFDIIDLDSYEPLVSFEESKKIDGEVETDLRAQKLIKGKAEGGESGQTRKD